MKHAVRSGFLLAVALTLSVAPVVRADASPPVLTAPKQSFVVGTSLTTSTLPTRVSWTASDADGIKSFKLYQSTDGGAWAGVALPTATATAIYRYLTPLHYYQFRVIATDNANNVSSATGPKFLAIAYDNGSNGVTYSSGWFTRSMSGAWKGSVRTRCYGGGTGCSSSAPGSWAKVTFFGRAVAFVAPRYPFAWFVDVYVDGLWKAKVDLYSGSNQYRRVNYVATWTTPGNHTLMVKYSLNPSPYKPNVDVDAFPVLR